MSASTSHSNSPWIIDSGAFGHITGSSPMFSTYIPHSGQDKVKIADGIVSSIFGKGLVQVSPSLSLSSVLHVPSFPISLLSISRITRNQNCSVTFFPSHCVFQDLLMRRTIGNGREENGLYLLEPQEQPHKAHHSTLAGSTSNDILLWHRRLGHPAFDLLKFLFPSLLSNKNVSTFRCEDCELRKHHRASFYPSNNKSTIPFSLVHTDVWGAFRVVT